TARLKFASQPPTTVLMAGLQGSGKTTTSGKLANWLKNGGHRPLLVSVDVYRPAARQQLKVVAHAIKANLYEGEVNESDTATVERLAKEARREVAQRSPSGKLRGSPSSSSAWAKSMMPWNLSILTASSRAF